jgi:hypothetical protein
MDILSLQLCSPLIKHHLNYMAMPGKTHGYIYRLAQPRLLVQNVLLLVGLISR